MKKTAIRIIVTVSIMVLFTGIAYSENIDMTQKEMMEQFKKSKKELLLEMFSKDDQLIILSFEHQLDQLNTFYNDRNVALLSTPTNIELFDVVVLFNDYKEGKDGVNIDEFLDYLLEPFEGKVDKDGNILPRRYANIDMNLKSFREKVLMDHNFLIKQQEYNQDKKDFLNDLYRVFKGLESYPEFEPFIRILEFKKGE